MNAYNTRFALGSLKFQVPRRLQTQKTSLLRHAQAKKSAIHNKSMAVDRGEVALNDCKGLSALLTFRFGYYALTETQLQTSTFRQTTLFQLTFDGTQFRAATNFKTLRRGHV